MSWAFKILRRTVYESLRTIIYEESRGDCQLPIAKFIAARQRVEIGNRQLAIGNDKGGRPKPRGRHLFAYDRICENFVRRPAYNSKGLPLRVILASRVSYRNPALTVRTHEI